MSVEVIVGVNAKGASDLDRAETLARAIIDDPGHQAWALAGLVMPSANNQDLILKMWNRGSETVS